MKRKKQIDLPNGCWCSPLTVYPKNWKNAGTHECQKPWYISYRFYSPNHLDSQGRIKPFQKVIKGMNEFLDPDSRIQATKELLNLEKYSLIDLGYNPITKTSAPEVEASTTVSQYTPLPIALEEALRVKDTVKHNRDDMEGTLRFLKKSIRLLRYENMAISEVRIGHVRTILEYCEKVKTEWNPKMFNKYHKHFSSLLSELKEMGAIEQNPALGLSKKKVVKTVRPTLSPEGRKKVDDHLRSLVNSYRAKGRKTDAQGMTAFRLFLRIFFSSGTRLTEIFTAKAARVNLRRQYFIIQQKKGKEYKEVVKTIPTFAIRYWKLLLRNAGPDDYCFSKRLQPGPVKLCGEKQVMIRWRVHVKKPLGIKADVNSMKHSHTTEVVDQYSNKVAADVNSHTTTKVVDDIYDVKYDQRKHETIKKINVSFL